MRLQNHTCAVFGDFIFNTPFVFTSRNDKRRKSINGRSHPVIGEWGYGKMAPRRSLGMLAVATAPAIPLAWWFNGVLLQLYDKRVGMRAELFIIGACLVMILGMGMVLSQIIRAARTDPVDIIRYE